MTTQGKAGRVRIDKVAVASEYKASDAAQTAKRHANVINWQIRRWRGGNAGMIVFRLPAR